MTLEQKARQALEALDAEGRWVSTHGGERLTGQPKLPPGSRFLSSEVFSRNVEALSDYLKLRSAEK